MYNIHFSFQGQLFKSRLSVPHKLPKVRATQIQKPPKYEQIVSSKHLHHNDNAQNIDWEKTIMESIKRTILVNIPSQLYSEKDLGGHYNTPSPNKMLGSLVTTMKYRGINNRQPPHSVRLPTMKRKPEFKPAFYKKPELKPGTYSIDSKYTNCITESKHSPSVFSVTDASSDEPELEGLIHSMTISRAVLNDRDEDDLNSCSTCGERR